MDDSSNGANFFKFVFNFDDNSKFDMMNIVQYTVLALVPVVALNKLMQKYIPEADDQKSSLELLAEILIQVIGMFLGLLFIHRMAIFVPTYSGVQYPDFNIIFIVLAVLMITLSLQTKLGEKVSILMDRLQELWDGTPAGGKKKKKKGSNNNNNNVQQINTIQTAATGGQMYSDGTSIDSLPQNGMPTQQMPNYDAMVRPDTTPLVGAASPEGYQGMGEIMPANAVLGGAFGSSLF